MKKLFLIFPIFFFSFTIIVFVYFLFVKRDPQEIPSVLINKQVPKFEAISLIDGKNYLLEDEFDNKTVIINFFSSWCIPCKTEHKYIKQLSKNSSLMIIGINYKDHPDEAKNWLEKLGNPYKNVFIDPNGRIGIDWGVYGIPETFIVSNNIVKYRLAGPITQNNFKEFYNKLLE
tara:strand:- start:1212 stop:1733 length:522 start_codon:yes stop_codon:yes gene_type:complete